jgi:hypothetical protein
MPLPLINHLIRLLPLLAWLALTGCVSVMRVDSAVQSHAQWPASAFSAGLISYEFERLPSQATGQAGTDQDMLEAQTRQALAAVGWQPVTAGGTPWRVAVSGQTVTLPRAPWDDPRDGWLLRHRLGVSASSGRGGPHIGALLSVDMPYYQRSVSLVVRDGQTGRVAYETRAAHDGRWHDSPAVWRAMIDAALQGFPESPAGQRTVNIDIPR